MTSPPPDRPLLTPAMTSADFERWYWLKAELESFARQLGIRAGGSKEALAARISATLAGTHTDEVRPAARPTAELVHGSTVDTVIPAGQRCSQPLRAWFTTQAGPGFRFDKPMREFFAATPGSRTLGDALRHWQHTRGGGAGEIEPQFEYNRFTRAHRAEHPGSDRAELLAAWTTYRNTPIDERGRI